MDNQQLIAEIREWINNPLTCVHEKPSGYIFELLRIVDEQVELIDALDSSWERAKQRWHTAEKQLEAVRGLSEKWRETELKERTATPDDPHALDGDDCADELEAILNKESSE